MNYNFIYFIFEKVGFICPKSSGRPELCPDPSGGAYSAPQIPSWWGRGLAAPKKHTTHSRPCGPRISALWAETTPTTFLTNRTLRVAVLLRRNSASLNLIVSCFTNSIINVLLRFLANSYIDYVSDNAQLHCRNFFQYPNLFTNNAK